jgi:hypothetical protein
MTEAEPSKTSLKTKIKDLTKTFAYGHEQSTSQQAATKPEVTFEVQFSAEREAEIDAQRARAAVDFPNPINETLKRLSYPTIEENEQWYDIPPKIDTDKNRELATKDQIRANILKSQRRTFYTTITKMKNRYMKDNKTTSPQEWRDI